MDDVLVVEVRHFESRQLRLAPSRIPRQSEAASFLVLPALHQIVQELIGLFVGQHRLLSGRLIYRVLDLADD